MTIDEMPKHRHAVQLTAASLEIGKAFSRISTSGSFNGNDELTAYVGNNQSHNNLQPYFTCFIWLRTE